MPRLAKGNCNNTGTHVNDREDLAGCKSDCDDTANCTSNCKDRVVAINCNAMSQDGVSQGLIAMRVA